MYRQAKERADSLMVENLRLKMEMQSISVGSTERNFLRSNMMTLISLCHPDRHRGSETANRITRELLEIRAGLSA